MKKILLSLSVVAAVAVVVVGATTAFFSDTETSTGNVLAAGAIDLGIDNESYFNGDPNSGTSWTLDFDLSKDANGDPEAHQLFNFSDLKPGDFGEDTISIHVNDNPSWVCAETTVRTDDDVNCSEPEMANDPLCLEPNGNTTDGDLADEIEIMWWADDGDNVLEVGEQVLDQGDLGQAPLGQAITSVLADSLNNIWTGNDDDPLPGATTKYIAKAWCFGNLSQNALSPGGYSGPDDPTNADETNELTSEDGGFSCTGASVIDNASQTDSITLDVAFRAEQSRNNPDFQSND